MPIDPEAAAALAAWDEWWATITDPATTPDQLVALADAEAIATVEELGAEFWTAAPFQRYAFATVGDATVTIEDCALGGGPVVVNGQPLSVSGRIASMRFTATFVSSGEGLRLTTFELPDRGCVPAPIAAAAIAGWNNHLPVLEQFWFNRNPADPSIAAVATGGYLEGAVAIAQRSLDENFQIRGDRAIERYPEIIEYRSLTEVVIRECLAQNPAYGAYDLSTGARREDLTPVPDPELQGVDEPTMVLEGGVWRISDRKASVNTSCALGPSSDGLTMVGAP